MTLNILFSAGHDRWLEYRAPLAEAFSECGLNAQLERNIEPALVDYIVYAPNGPVLDFSPFTNARAVLSLWAGVEQIVTNPTLTIPLARMVDSGLAEGMVEWVTGHTLRYHLGIDAQLNAQNGNWAPAVPPLARNRTVGILGLGELGRACARALVALNFNVSGWSRSQKSLPGVTCLSADEGLGQILEQSEIIILLLPLTTATENLINRDRLSRMRKGAFLLNPGRGALIEDAALLDALDSGQVAHATLDVFRTEPLPQNHPFWAHPGVTVTPHIASETRPDTASQVIAENIRRSEAGEPLKFLVDRKAGY